MIEQTSRTLILRKTNVKEKISTNEFLTSSMLVWPLKKFFIPDLHTKVHLANIYTACLPATGGSCASSSCLLAGLKLLRSCRSRAPACLPASGSCVLCRPRAPACFCLPVPSAGASQEATEAVAGRSWSAPRRGNSPSVDFGRRNRFGDEEERWELEGTRQSLYGREGNKVGLFFTRLRLPKFSGRGVTGVFPTIYQCSLGNDSIVAPMGQELRSRCHIFLRILKTCRELFISLRFSSVFLGKQSFPSTSVLFLGGI
jgi:hypothetical protein